MKKIIQTYLLFKLEGDLNSLISQSSRILAKSAHQFQFLLDLPCVHVGGEEWCLVVLMVVGGG